MNTTRRSQIKWAHRIHVIHLSKAKERLRTFQSLNKIDGIRFEFVEGIDSALLDPAELRRQKLIKPGTMFRTPGCGLTHRKLWLASLQTRTPLIVCEDDAVIRRDFRNQFSKCICALPKQWHLLLLGYNFDAMLEVEIIAGVERLSGRFSNKMLSISRLKNFQKSILPISVLPLRNAFGTPGYAVSPAGAKYLLEQVFPLRNIRIALPFDGSMLARSMDAVMNGLYSKMKAFACLPPLVVSPNKKDPNARMVTVD
ncbi:MAG TPA: glycosyltransferase family 25 protein [Alphaproteobacteria bacterium]|nr:glycosyltransferase family 25 protein [Alphaproteobacteria bacterium]